MNAGTYLNEHVTKITYAYGGECSRELLNICNILVQAYKAKYKVESAKEQSWDAFKVEAKWELPKR
jgi:hypothetical protein